MPKYRFFGFFSVVALAMTTNAVWADGNASKNGFYAGASGAVAVIGDVDFSNNSGGTTRSVEFGTSAGGQLRVGYDFGMIRADFEFGYLDAEIDGVSGATDGSGDINVFSGLVTGAMDFELSGGFVPYVSLGAGAIGVEGDISFTSSNGSRQTKKFGDVAPALTVGAGLGYKFGDQITAQVGYQLLGSYSDEANEDNFIDIHMFKLGLNVSF